MSEIESTTLEEISLADAEAFVKRANQLRDDGAKEEPLKANLFHHLPLIFPGAPNWINHHIAGAETHLKVMADGKSVSRFTDSLVGLTTIEYEPDLRKADRYAGGLKQVHEHCAGLLNSGASPDQIVGVLSDTVLWMAFTVNVSADVQQGGFSADDVQLDVLEQLDASKTRPAVARDLADFIARHLGRQGARPLNAQTIATDLGFNSLFGATHLDSVVDLVDKAFAARPAYADLIQRLWVRFVSIAGSGGRAVKFDRKNYSDELYLVTLAKLVCANVLAGKALRSTDSEVRRILNGDHFESLGLDNLVEYDYFGWLGESPHVETLIPTAMAIQEDLRAYDFGSVSGEDLFGHLMSELGRRAHRLLLGQEYTPSWLCSQIAERLIDGLPNGEAPQFVDMCCGSGAMLVAVCNRYGEQLLEEDPNRSDPFNLRRLTQAATGFDIDPLAVMLAKINWVLANRAWLADGSRVSIPVYHADSLFAGIPFADADESQDAYQLKLHGDVAIELPDFLIDPENRALFDDLVYRAYEQSRAAGEKAPEGAAVRSSSDNALADFGAELDEAETTSVQRFYSELVEALANLQRAGLNGLWAFILKNSYRPALVAGQFNGIISNPPWLALSKVADNPYGESLKEIATRHALSPPGPSHLHTELATVFLYASVGRYLVDGSVIGCILPDAVLNGYQHKPFRTGAPQTSPARVSMSVDELWRVERGTFKNEAIVLFGQKTDSISRITIPGRLVSSGSTDETAFRVVQRGNRTIWTDVEVEAPELEFFNAGDFRQGADLMPRTLIFHGLTRVGDRWAVGPIDRQASPLRYLVRNAKQHEDFVVDAGTVSDDYVFHALMSNHLAPFHLEQPALCTFPFRRSGADWYPVSSQELAADPPSADHFSQTLAEFGDSADADALLSHVETQRRKLSGQCFEDGFLVVYGAGGSVVCAAAVPLEGLDVSKLVIDQTLYWNVVETEAESRYLSGLFNSAVINRVIAPFQPKGQQGKRHIHRLPVNVTPRFDPSDPAHQAVVSATVSLLSEWTATMSDPEVLERLDPNMALAPRRSALRKRMSALSSYGTYEQACEAVYTTTDPRSR